MAKAMTVLVKICGLKTEAALDAALGGGADMIGLVFFARSPRNVDLATAARLAEHARGRAKIATLTVDADDASLAGIVEAVRPDILQLHGRETPERVRAVKARFGVETMKAIGIATRADLAAIDSFADAADHLLLDAKPPPAAILPGGNGQSFDWDLLAGLDPAHGFMLSGGLDPQNVAEAIRRVRPKGVDVSSGVESAPGEKDPAKIAAFIAAARRAAAV